MVGAVITADGLDHNNIHGLIRVSPSNQDYVEALRSYLDTLAARPSAMVVFDYNSDTRGDLFTDTLKVDFERRMEDLIQFPPQSFVGKSIPSDARPGRFGAVTNTICSVQQLDIVFYAGREVDLDGFLQFLENRPCREVTPLTVMTGGSDIGTLLERREQALAEAKLTVVFASTTYPEGWEDGIPGTPQGYPEFLESFRSHGFDTGNLEDGGAIMMHDALLTAAEAVERAATGGQFPTAGDVRSELLNLNGLHQVQGASGTFSFSSSDQGEGNPIGKPVPVLQYPRPTGSLSRQVAIYVTE